MIHIGEIIRNYCADHRIPISDVAAKARLSRTHIYKIIRSSNPSVLRLWDISNAVGHNFFQYFVNPAGLSTSATSKLTAENRSLKAKIASQQKEIQYQADIIALLKSQRQP
jgi:transcriptional regulator with XRE-family HTH domain